MREVRREDHVGAALPDLEFVGERVRRAPEVGGGDHIEDGLRRGPDLLHERAERLEPPTGAEIERQRAAREEPVGAPQAESDDAGGDQRRRRLHVLATTAASFPGLVTQNRRQACVVGRLK